MLEGMKRSGLQKWSYGMTVFREEFVRSAGLIGHLEISLDVEAIAVNDNVIRPQEDNATRTTRRAWYFAELNPKRVLIHNSRNDTA